MIVINALVVGAICCFEDRISDFCTNFVCDCLDEAFICTDDCLIEKIDVVGLIVCVGSFSDGGCNSCAPVAALSAQATALALSRTDLTVATRRFRWLFWRACSFWRQVQTCRNRVVCALEHLKTCCLEIGGYVVVVLVVGVLWKRQLFDGFLHQISCSSTSSEDCVRHGGKWINCLEKEVVALQKR